MKKRIFNNTNNFNNLIVEKDWSRNNFIFPAQ